VVDPPPNVKMADDQDRPDKPPNRTDQKEEQDRFLKAISLIVDYSIVDSLATKPQIYADAILPALLPILRRAIGTFMNDLVVNIQQILEKSLSAESIKWRFEAMRSGKPFAEIAVLHSLIYRVEQVLLIDHQSGLLLAHVESRDPGIADADLISGMLTAVTDFILDSFQIQNTTESGTIQYGQQLIWIERGKQVTVAALVRGQPSLELRETLRNALTQIEERKIATQERLAATYLKSCLAAAYRPRERRSEYWRNIAIGIVAILLLIPVLCIAMHVRSLVLLNHYDSVLRNIPGIVVTQAEVKSGHFYFYGFLDRYAQDPRVVLQEAKLDPKRVTLDFKPFISEDSSILERRLRVVLSIPKSIQFKIINGILHLVGSAPFSWFISNRDKLRIISGLIPFDMSELSESEYLKIVELKEKLERQTFAFRPGFASLSSNEIQRLHGFKRDLSELNRLTEETQRDWTLLIEGSSDDNGTFDANQRIGHQRANEVAQILVRMGISESKIKVGSLGFAGKDGRAVHFQVSLFDSQMKGTRMKGHHAS